MARPTEDLSDNENPHVRGEAGRKRLFVTVGTHTQQFDRLVKEIDRLVEEKKLTGDGTVPFEGAVPSFLKPENLVCVTPDDFGYWEFQDKIISKAAGFHGMIPNMNMIHRLIVRHFTGRKDYHGNTWGRSVPGVTKDKWQPPMELDYKE